MTYLSEDPTFLVGGLLALAAAFGIALRVTQRGKHLIGVIVAVGLALLVVVIEWAWVTDAERIENTVEQLRQAVLSSDVDAVMSHLAPDVRFLKGDAALDGKTTRALIRASLSETRFDFIRVSNVRINVGQQSRRGTAEFQAIARTNRGAASSVWSLGFQEAGPGLWKVNRITPVEIPREALAAPSGVPGLNRSSLDNDDDDEILWRRIRGDGRRRSAAQARGERF